MSLAPLLHPPLALALAPLLPGIVNRVKAKVGGRQGQPVLQLYVDLLKLARKGAVYSRTSTWALFAGPLGGMAALLVAAVLVPFGGVAPGAGIPGDFILLAGLLGLARLLTVWSALDTGSAFEGMGASREVTVAALAEPVLLLSLAVLVRRTGGLSLAAIFGGLDGHAWATSGPALVLAAAALFAVFLAENARIPVDDPATHLELTMIHEAMVLDHGGPEFGLIQLAAALRLWVLGALLVGVLLPEPPSVPAAFLLDLAGMVVMAAVTGLVESSMARLRMTRVPGLLLGAGVLAALALVLVLR